MPSLLGRSAVELSLVEMMSIAIEAVGTELREPNGNTEV